MQAFQRNQSCTFSSFKLFEKLHNHAIIYMKNDQSPQNVFYYISYIILAKAPRSQRISQVFVTQTETNWVILWTISSLKISRGVMKNKGASTQFQMNIFKYSEYETLLIGPFSLVFYGLFRVGEIVYTEEQSKHIPFTIRYINFSTFKRVPYVSTCIQV